MESKNIHVLPTDKPSRLSDCYDNKLHLDDVRYLRNYQNIYITNDENINENDWCLDKFNQKWKLEDKKLIAFDSKGIKRFSTDNILGHECKKIILTTDQDLIVDGVRAIDDEFLEWFIRNPTCEFVNVELETMFKGYMTYPEIINKPPFYGNLKYKIIIPKKEPKQLVEEYEQQGLEKYSHELNQETLKDGTIIQFLNGSHSYEGVWFGDKHPYREGNFWWRNILNEWQAKRMYSEEEVINILVEFSAEIKNVWNITEWFEQLKKK